MNTNDSDASQGLHLLKSWKQKSYLPDQCAELADNLDEAIAAAAAAAPERKSKPLFDNNADRTKRSEMGSTQQERILEAKLFEQFGPMAQDTAVKGVWSQLLGYQIPLYEDNKKNGWGAVDLLAITENTRPAIVELKRGSSGESVLRPVIEAASYAVALRKNWDVLVREISELEWCSIDIASLGKASDPIPLILISPKEYWERATNLSRVSGKGRVEGYWADYRRVLSGLEEHGFPVVFASIDNAEGKVGELEVTLCHNFPPHE